ncbi:MMPL family transporter [Streptomyces sp.]|uniref:MMPL family transporter n=1 Tax=Streptomyces sp. TaxID=1931 RepID=UPI002810F012|nr:MMPL family transporter [Streptomyces sp.]
MATLLYRIGRFAFRRRGLTVLLWFLVLGGAGVAASSAPPPPVDTFSMPGTESQKAVDLLNEKFPDAGADGASARVAVRAPGGGKVTDPGVRKNVAALVADLAKAPQVAAASDPFTSDAVSEDATTAYTVVTYEVSALEVSDRAHDALLEAADDGRERGLTVEMGGDAVPVEQAAGGTAESVGVAVAALILLVTFGSLVAAGMPLLTAVMGVGIGVSAIGALGSTLGLSSTSTTLALMIGLAVGIDYALFIVSRYRTELIEGLDREEAAGRAVGTAGSAVVFAGLTVIVALAGLTVVNVPMLTKMGLAAAGTVLIAVLVAVTFVPALLGFAPVRVLRRADRHRITGKPLSERRQRRAARAVERQRPNLGSRWAGFVLRRPLVVLLVGVVGLGVVAVPATRLELGLPGEGTMAPDTTQRKAYDMLSESFGPGFNGPLLVTVAADEARGVGKAVAAELSGEPAVAEVGPVVPNTSGDTAIINVVPEGGPTDDRTRHLVEKLRDDLSDFARTHDAEILVGGQTAMFLDFSRTLDDALLPYLALVVGLAFLLLVLVFRSLTVPLKAALGFLLSVSAALGAVVAIFQWGWFADIVGVDQPGPIMSTMPIIMIGVVFGLAMDYEVFLVTRMREAFVHGESTSQAVVTGFRHGGRVVAAAALIMTSVFSGFIMEDNVFVRMIGLGLALAVLFDAFVVRMAIVPALFALLGDRAWWLPRWLDRALPDMDVEGEKLSHRPPAARGRVPIP